MMVHVQVYHITMVSDGIHLFACSVELFASKQMLMHVLLPLLAIMHDVVTYPIGSCAINVN